ncbi:MAG: succinylglutamate desuccinylase/aspartoacylase family protein [Gammaproteobacteria bacterium]|nr:succinylglutamate desuccinylase/aspartoacylase family protein [Gammaproteobacteria bacterium]
MLNEMNHIPDEFLQAKAEDLHSILKSPTLFHLEGVNPQPLFVCTLLHGNETTGLYAIQRLLKKYQDRPLPRAISLFVGNIAAARENQRRLDTQDDYNRIWPGSHHSDSAEKDMMQIVTSIMEKRKPFASIDIHNNTGKNPHYGCINILNPHGLVLASEFSDIAVYFTDPKGVQSSAFSDFCPAVVLECGQASDRSGEDHAFSYLDKIIQMDDLSSGNSNNLKLYHTIARVLIPKTVTLGDAGDISLNTQLEDKNFHQIQPGIEFASVDSTKEQLIIVSSESHEDITNEYLERDGDKLLFKKPITLSMFTTSERAIRQDCVCYFMEELRIG